MVRMPDSYADESIAVRANFMLHTLQAATETESVPSLVNQISRRLGEFGLMLHETTTDIAAVADESERQVVQFKRLRESAELMVEVNGKSISLPDRCAQATINAGQAELSGCRRHDRLLGVAERTEGPI
jgi:hypothetical protein